MRCKAAQVHRSSLVAPEVLGLVVYLECTEWQHAVVACEPELTALPELCVELAAALRRARAHGTEACACAVAVSLHSQRRTQVP